jgi:hypothetical protein
VKRSGTELENQIWRNGEPSHFSLNSCYVSRRLKGGERSVVRSETEQVKFEFYYINFCEADYLLGHARFFVSFFKKENRNNL